MKKIFVIVFSVIVNVINAQTKTLPLDTKGDRVKGAYYKDLNNELVPYTGTWMGQVKGNTFQITFERVKEYDEYRDIWKDKLYGKYEMKDSNRNNLYSTYNSDKIKVKSYTFVENKAKLNFVFIDSCIMGDIYIKFTDSTKTKIEWEYEAISQTIVESKLHRCAKINEMPQERFILVKQ